MPHCCAFSYTPPELIWGTTNSAADCFVCLMAHSSFTILLGFINAYFNVICSCSCLEQQRRDHTQFLSFLSFSVCLRNWPYKAFSLHSSLLSALLRSFNFWCLESMGFYLSFPGCLDQSSTCLGGVLWAGSSLLQCLFQGPS